MSLNILRSGMLSTLQDGGRWGHQKEGIVVNGPMDPLAHRIANLLVGNPETASALEICLTGPKIRFEKDHLIAITGLDVTPRINGTPVKLLRPLLVRKGSVLEFGALMGGRFAYLAVAGSFDLPAVLGSTATYLQAGFGGYLGRALQAGDLLPSSGAPDKAHIFFHQTQRKSSDTSFLQAAWAPTSGHMAGVENPAMVRIIRGPEWDLFTTASQKTFLEEAYTVSRQSDRMGYCLQGDSLGLSEPAELLSTAVTAGTVQVPANGQPIVLMADHQTTGGYPRIGQIATVDLPKLAQLHPAKRVRFLEISLQQAQQLYLEQERQLQKLKQAIHLKFKYTT